VSSRWHCPRERGTRAPPYKLPLPANRPLRILACRLCACSSLDAR
jgi:hypothetical protein